MNKNGEIIIIEDDADDQYMLEKVFIELEYPNKRIYFSDGEDALKYLHKSVSRPFLIISDINLPKLKSLAIYLTITP